MVYYYAILLLLILPMSYAYIGQVRKIDVRNLVLPICVGVLAFFMSCRAVSVGADTCQYTWGFEQIVHIPWSKLFTAKIYGAGGGYELNFEYGYRLYNKLISIVTENSQMITVANSLLIMALLSRLIKSHSPYVFLSIWLYVTLGIFQTQMNMARNAIAILICYIGCSYIKKHDFKRFLRYIIIATLFHTSSILFAPLYWLVNNIRLTEKKIIRLLLVSIFCGVTFSWVRPFAIRFLPFGLGRYFAGNTSKMESLIIGAFHLALVLFVILLINKRNRANAVEYESVGIWMLVLEMLFFCIGYDVASATRMAALFGPYLIVSIPNLIDRGIASENMKLNAIALVVILTGAQYVARLQINNIGSTMPYMFFWE